MSYTPVVSDIPRNSQSVSLILILSSVDNRSPCVMIKIGFSSAPTVDNVNWVLRYSLVQNHTAHWVQWAS